MASVQTPGAITSVIALYSYIPLVLTVVGIVVLWFTNLDKDLGRIQAELAEKK